VQRMVLMSEEELITLKDVPKDVAQAGAVNHRRFRVPPQGIQLDEEVAAFERRWLEAALAQTEGIKAAAARLLGLNPDRMKYLCRKHKL